MEYRDVNEALDAYKKHFGEPLAEMFWQGRSDKLIDMITVAIRKNRPITQDDLMRAQGLEPPKGEAIY